MASFQIGFYIIIVLAACKLVLIALEFSNIPQINAKSLRVFGRISAILALLLGCMPFIRARADEPDEPGQCDSADADIVGDGVRAAAWTQVGILFFITLTGLWHIYKTAVKEIGGGLIITHVSLAIALLVPLVRGELSPIDAILGSLLLDAQGNSLSIQLMTKETLAARWQVAIVLVAQFLGLVIEGVLMGYFTTNLHPTSSNCDCFSAFWWAWLSNCPSSSPNDAKPFWIYFGYRFVNIFHGAFFSTTRTKTYDDAEKWDRENPCDSCNECRRKGTPSIYCKCQLCETCCYCKVCKRRQRGFHQRHHVSDGDESNHDRPNNNNFNNHRSNSRDADADADESNNDGSNNDETLANSYNSIASGNIDNDGQVQNGNNGVSLQNGINDIPLQNLDEMRGSQNGSNKMISHADNNERLAQYEESDCTICDDCQRCHGCGHTDLEAGQAILLAGERYSEFPVTVSVNFLENSVLALLSMVSAEVTMGIKMVKKTSPLYSVGQVTALVIAGGTAIRALWVFFYMFSKRKTPSAYETEREHVE
ncbi:hypothetical protein F4814DRAFT_452283 [Daldinia grandis]|nr:hypothetical protein F4814DRAFT_452283 [Daldinia grandis]